MTGEGSVSGSTAAMAAAATAPPQAGLAFCSPSRTTVLKEHDNDDLRGTARGDTEREAKRGSTCMFKLLALATESLSAEVIVGVEAPDSSATFAAVPSQLHNAEKGASLEALGLACGEANASAEAGSHSAGRNDGGGEANAAVFAEPGKNLVGRGRGRLGNGSSLGPTQPIQCGAVGLLSSGAERGIVAALLLLQPHGNDFVITGDTDLEQEAPGSSRPPPRPGGRGSASQMESQEGAMLGCGFAAAGGFKVALPEKVTSRPSSRRNKSPSSSPT
mmetsp:Transcript_117984/g.263857  ORF Transcript_117984/g.263857 Transcript_117984/m.263857 type:complete len:275 (+) Transcript_117984:501-1325(+)